MKAEISEEGIRSSVCLVKYQLKWWPASHAVRKMTMLTGLRRNISLLVFMVTCLSLAAETVSDYMHALF